ncbi:aspartate/glutamate racemase family protein [Leptolyngbya sp. CCNP1308]|uniref:aspartate/glutamate racemase family protein n=1 Tax=Leptolyngbya sp. CCNP1308 TaxID=3110255 RepID=UPI002B2090FF|nr:aspartate/glutamate racemase family protein [Leptolyngbya sp. CCNP1308]MEA5452866.1 aspartate/glutamate racemase family protein [Leptolyngbya sp. CCNP1308]
MTPPPMKTIGLIGGMSWESSLEYYRILNQTTRARRGGLHSAKVILFSVDFADMAALQHQGDWAEISGILIEAGQQLQMAGAGMVLICANTMHRLADDIEARISIPLLHIADVTADCVKAQRLQRIGLLGTRFTMEQDFYRDRLTQHGLEVLVPDAAGREAVHQIIYDELCQGRFTPASRETILALCEQLATAGAEGVILGCTELELLVGDATAAVPLFPTTRIHAEAAVELALGG